MSNRHETYKADGFQLEPGPVLSADTVAAAVEGMDQVREGHYDTGQAPEESQWKPGDDPNALCKIEMPQMASRGIRALVSDCGLGAHVAEVTGSEAVQVWWTQLLYKPSATATSAPVIGWHQDRYFWRIWSHESNLFTAWVALSDVDEESGPMQFVRGSHHWGFTGEGTFQATDFEATRDMITLPEGQQWEEVSALLPPGGVSTHHNLVFHGSGPNQSGRPRRSLAIHMRSEGSRPANGGREGLARHIDNLDICPVIHGDPALFGD